MLTSSSSRYVSAWQSVAISRLTVNWLNCRRDSRHFQYISQSQQQRRRRRRHVIVRHVVATASVTCCYVSQSVSLSVRLLSYFSVESMQQSRRTLRCNEAVQSIGIRDYTPDNSWHCAVACWINEFSRQSAIAVGQLDVGRSLRWSLRDGL